MTKVFPLLEGPWKARSFPTAATASRHEVINRRLAQGMRSTMNAICPNRAERKGAYAFFAHDGIDEELLKDQLYLKCVAAAAAFEGELTAIGDTCEYNYTHNGGRLGGGQGLGCGSFADQDRSFLLHPQLLTGTACGTLLGFGDVQMWHRVEQRPGADTCGSRPFEHKESYRWWVGIANTHRRLSDGNRVINYVQDREADGYELFERVGGLVGAQLVSRSCRDRRILTQSGEGRKLYEYVGEQPVSYCYLQPVRVPYKDRRGGSPRRYARMEVRAAAVRLVRPGSKDGAASLPVEMVWARERAEGSTAPFVKGKQQLLDWKLLTTRRVGGCVERMRAVLAIYARRWLIEEVFYVTKSGCFELDKAKLENGYRLRKLGIMVLDNALTVARLRQAHRGEDQSSGEELFDAAEGVVLEKVCEELQGKTEALRNPHEPHTTAYAAWTIARLGGWKGYRSSRPPGMKTMARGLERFQLLVWGAKINDT